MSVTVNVQSLSKRFKLYSNARDRFVELVNPFKKKYHHDFWALKDVSFSISHGETVGIIGRNGSGKSTLLQIITMVMSPTSGLVETNGRVAALLELGTGFDSELTGRENLFLNGSIMGLSRKQIQERIPLIETFADIGEFFDQPVKLYSSGMFVRLAFSAAIHVNPDILIVDEALAVGDVKFQNKCYRKFHEFKELGKTIIFVTHSIDLVAKLCSRAILIHDGQLVCDGESNKVINRYLELLLGGGEKQQHEKEPDAALPEQDRSRAAREKQEADNSVNSFIQEKSVVDCCALNPTYNPNEHRYGNGKGKIIDYLVIEDKKVNSQQLKSGSFVQIYAKYIFFEPVGRPIYGLTLKTVDGVEIFGSNSFVEKTDIKPKKPGDISIVQFRLPISVKNGDYFISIGLAEFASEDVEPLDRRYDMIHLNVYNPGSRLGIVDLDFALQEITQDDF